MYKKQPKERVGKNLPHGPHPPNKARLIPTNF